MSKRQKLMILGLWIMGFLFLGFPSGLDKIFAILTGLLVIFFALKMDKPKSNQMKRDAPYIDRRSDRAESPEEITNSQEPI